MTQTYRSMAGVRGAFRHLPLAWPGRGASLSAWRDFLAWWRRSLIAWLPQTWRALLWLDDARLLLLPSGDGLIVRRQHAGGCAEVATLPLPLQRTDLDAVLDARAARLPLWLLLPAARALRRPLELPATATERLRDVVGYEIDRQTPFTPAQVQFDARVLSRRSNGRILAELVAAPRDAFDRAIAALGGLSADLAGVDVADAEGRPLGVNLLPPDARRRRDPLLRGHLMLAAVTIAAMATAAWTVLDNRHAAEAIFSAHVEAQAAQARSVAARRRQLADLVEGMRFLDDARARRPTMVEVLDDLSRRLPDDTYLERVSVEGDRILLAGFSSQPSALVQHLAGSRLWRTPALTGALQSDPTTRRDRFTLQAELVTVRDAGAGMKNAGSDAGH